MKQGHILGGSQWSTVNSAGPFGTHISYLRSRDVRDCAAGASISLNHICSSSMY